MVATTIIVNCYIMIRILVEETQRYGECIEHNIVVLIFSLYYNNILVLQN